LKKTSLKMSKLYLHWLAWFYTPAIFTELPNLLNKVKNGPKEPTLNLENNIKMKEPWESHKPLIWKI